MKRFTVIILAYLFISSCTKEFVTVEGDVDLGTGITGTENASLFLYNTTEETLVTVEFLDPQQNPLKNVYAEIYFENPYKIRENGFLLLNPLVKPVFKGMSDNLGFLETRLNIPTRIEKIYVRPFLPGLVNVKGISVNSRELKIVFGNEAVDSSESSSVSKKTVSSYLSLGSWNSVGYPYYQESQKDKFDTGFLNDVNSTLPEFVSLVNNHPELFDGSLRTDITISEEAEVYITFVHEGAEWNNTLGYFHYPEGEAPQDASGIKNKIIAFPNVSLPGSGGALQSGVVVQLKYWDENKGEFMEKFPAGTVISWFLIARGWDGYVTEGAYTLFSNSSWNTPSDPEKRQHMVVHQDQERGLFLLSFEDMRRDGITDEDFNDAIFYVRANPPSAISKTNYTNILTSEDSDGDGVPDEQDDFPENPELAYKITYPSADQYGTLAFEDFWPKFGDYDFNDLVVDYQFDHLADKNNMIKYVDGRLITRAVGGSYHNGFAFQMTANTQDVRSVSGYKTFRNYIHFNSAGTEAGQEKATIIVYDNAWGLFGYPAVSDFINTTAGSSYFNPVTTEVRISFADGLGIDEVGIPPYNPFLIVDLDRSHEVHLPGYEPTDLADRGLFGTGDDTSDPVTGDYYVSAGKLPWGLNLPVSFDYPIEKASILNAYTYFSAWAAANGMTNADWYMNILGYREEALIY